jgi:hypothetical protein
VKDGGRLGARRGEAGEAALGLGAALSITGSMATAAALSLPGGADDDKAERCHSPSTAAARGRRTWRRGDAGAGGGISPAGRAPPLPMRSPPADRRAPLTLPSLLPPRRCSSCGRGLPIPPPPLPTSPPPTTSPPPPRRVLPRRSVAPSAATPPRSSAARSAATRRTSPPASPSSATATTSSSPMRRRRRRFGLAASA